MQIGCPLAPQATLAPRPQLCLDGRVQEKIGATTEFHSLQPHLTCRLACDWCMPPHRSTTTMLPAASSDDEALSAVLAVFFSFPLRCAADTPLS